MYYTNPGLMLILAFQEPGPAVQTSVKTIKSVSEIV